MPTATSTLRIFYASCLAGATCVHIATHIQYGVLLGGLANGGYPFATRIFWSSLTLFDPLAALLLFVRPRAGLALASAIITADVAHNSWILYHFGMAPTAAYCAQVGFLVFFLSTLRIALRGISRNEQKTA